MFAVLIVFLQSLVGISAHTYMHTVFFTIHIPTKRRKYEGISGVLLLSKDVYDDDGDDDDDDDDDDVDVVCNEAWDLLGDGCAHLPRILLWGPTLSANQQ